MFENTEAISISATAEDANLEIPANETGQEAPPTTVIENDGGHTSLSVTADPVESTPTPADAMPEKFANAEDPNAALLKAYLELEKGQGKTIPDAPEKPLSEAADKALEAIQEDRVKADTVKDLSQQWADQGGSLTDDQWAKASTDLGVSIEDLRKYEAYRNAENSKAADAINTNDQAIYDAVGGKDQYGAMIDWAEGNLDQGQLDALNTQLDNPAFSAMGANMLKQMYINSVGSEAAVSTLDRAVGADVSGDMFHSEAEVLEAQRHKDYGKDGAYDKAFDQKLYRFMKANGQIQLDLK